MLCHIFRKYLAHCFRPWFTFISSWIWGPRNTICISFYANFVNKFHVFVFQFDIPSHVGVREVIEKTMDDTIDGGKPRKEYFMDTTKLIVPRADTEIVSFLKDGLSQSLLIIINLICIFQNFEFLVEDWDVFEQMWDYILYKCLGCDTKEHPMLFSEPTVSLSTLIQT